MSKIVLTKRQAQDGKGLTYAYSIQIPHKKGVKAVTLFEITAPQMHPGNLKPSLKHPDVSYYMRDEIGIYARLFQGDILTVANENGDLMMCFNRLESKPKLTIYQEPKSPFLHFMSSHNARRARFAYENKSPTARLRRKINRGLILLGTFGALTMGLKYIDGHQKQINETTEPVIEKITRNLDSLNAALNKEFHR